MARKSKNTIFWKQVYDDRSLQFLLTSAVAAILSFVFALLNYDLKTVIGSFISMAIMLLIIALAMMKHRRTALLVFGTKHLPAVFCIGRPKEDADQMLSKAKSAITRLTGFKEFDAVENHLNIRYDDLVVHKRERIKPDPLEWEDYIDDGQRQIRRFTDRLEGDKVYHIFIYGAAVLALAAGVAFGTKQKLICYHFEEGEYKPVLDLSHDNRRIKEALQADYRYIKISHSEYLTPESVFILHLASHVPTTDVIAYMKSKQQEMGVVEITSAYSGNLKDEDWSEAVREVYAAITRVKAEGKIQKIHLFHSMPIPMAFGLGMALGNFVPVTVYNWEREEQTYFPVLELNKLKSLI
jgi:hypothetical protein